MKAKRYTWSMVKAACEAGKFTALSCYISYDDYGRKVLRDNNGWIQAYTPAQCRFFVIMD